MAGIEAALAQAMAQIRPKIDNALGSEVAIAVKVEEAVTIGDVVYGAYAPIKYKRRYANGGLGSPSNMEDTVAGGTLTVVNTTPPKAGKGYTTNKDLAEVVEYGSGYDFPSDGAYMNPRPFTEQTTANLAASKEHVSALRSGLIRQGLKVK